MLEKFEEPVGTLKALAHPIRLAIVTGLSKCDSCNVSKMVDNLGVSQPIVSQQLNVLKKARIIEGYRDGSQICYKVISDYARKIILDLELDCSTIGVE